MTITADQIITLLKTGTYPYSLTQFFKYKQKLPWYPSVEVSRIQPDSYNEDVIKTERNFSFEIRVYIKYTRLQDQELIDQSTIEDTISTLLRRYDFQGQGKIFLDTFGWTRTDLGNPVWGSISSIRLGIKDITSTDGNGYVGAYNILELNSDTTPVQIQILSSTLKDGRNLAQHNDDAGNIMRDPTQYNLGDFSITYENTPALETLISGIQSNFGGTIKGKLIKGSVIKQYIFQLGDTVKSGGYSEVERSTLRLTVEGTW